MQVTSHKKQFSSTAGCTAGSRSAQVTLLTPSLACTRGSAASPGNPAAAGPGQPAQAGVCEPPQRGWGQPVPSCCGPPPHLQGRGHVMLPLQGRGCHTFIRTCRKLNWVALPLVRLAPTPKLLHRHSSLQVSPAPCPQACQQGYPQLRMSAAKMANSSVRPASASDTCQSHGCHGPPSRPERPLASEP